MSRSRKDIIETQEMLHRLSGLLGQHCADSTLSYGDCCQDAESLRRISMTLHRWHELECGTDNGWASVCIARGHKVVDLAAPGKRRFEYDEDKGKPYLEMHPNNGGPTRYDRIDDREAGARKRLATIMARYPSLTAYVQGDPRGCALYILTKADIPEGAAVDSCYSRGLAVHQ